MKWIDIDEKLPPKGVYVLTARSRNMKTGPEFKFASLAMRSHDDYIWLDENEEELKFKYGKITHWMFIPDLPHLEVQPSPISRNGKHISLVLRDDDENAEQQEPNLETSTHWILIPDLPHLEGKSLAIRSNDKCIWLDTNHCKIGNTDNSLGITKEDVLEAVKDGVRDAFENCIPTKDELKNIYFDSVRQANL